MKTVALVWKHFGFETDKSGKPRSPDRPKCSLCDMEVAAKCANTSNLYSHLKNKHPKCTLRYKMRGQGRQSSARTTV